MVGPQKTIVPPCSPGTHRLKGKHTDTHIVSARIKFLTNRKRGKRGSEWVGP